MLARPHAQNAERLAALRRYQILDTPRERGFDEVVELASKLCETPISVVNLIDQDRQWFKAEVGLGVRSTPLDTSICAHAILDDEFVEISDTQIDRRLEDNPLCFGDPPLRFYAGALLKTAEGLPLGTLCVLDYRPRTLTPLQRETLQVLSRQVMRQLELRLALSQQEVLRLEIDHRVKNSLQSVSAIIRMQERRSRNDDVKQALRTVSDRISTVAALHDELHRVTLNETIELKAFMARNEPLYRGAMPENIELKLDLQPWTIESRRASAVGMIANEFIANAIKHAFPGGRGGRINMTGRAEPGSSYTIVLEDDGPGGNDALSRIAASTGLGTRIIAASAASLDASFDWQAASPGTRLVLKALY